MLLHLINHIKGRKQPTFLLLCCLVYATSRVFNKGTFIRLLFRRIELKQVHMIHSYGVNVCVFDRKDTGTTQINSHSAPFSNV